MFSRRKCFLPCWSFVTFGIWRNVRDRARDWNKSGRKRKNRKEKGRRVYTHPCYMCSRRYFGLARNLIRCIISPNQDDLSYSSRISFFGSRNWVSCQTLALWLNNAVQCRRPIGRSSIAAAAWTQWGNLSNLWIPCSYHLDQGIPVEYELDTFNTLPQEQLYVTPKIGYVDAMPNPTPTPSSCFASGPHIHETTRFSPK